MGRVGALAAPLLLLLGQAACMYESTTGLPIVDLGYELHQASNFNVRLSH
jgi:hypothetical protein